MDNRKAIKYLQFHCLPVNESTNLYKAVMLAISALEKQDLIPVTEKLPQEGVWVWGYVKNIHAGDNIPPVEVVRIEFGISKLERERLKNNGDERAKCFTISDEWGNNKVPYSWSTSGNMKYFGQEIVAWRPIE